MQDAGCGMRDAGMRECGVGFSGAGREILGEELGNFRRHVTNHLRGCGLNFGGDLGERRRCRARNFLELGCDQLEKPLDIGP